MAAIMHIVYDLCSQLNWILPVSVFITVVLGRFPFTFHSHLNHPKNTSAQDVVPETTYSSQSSSGARCARGGTSMPGGCEKLDYENGQWKRQTRPGPIATQPPPRDYISPALSLMDLPAEIQLLIFRYCAPIPTERLGPDSMDTFLTLLQVSKAIQQQAYMACLPHIPLALWSKKGVRSFRALLIRRPELGCLVRHLWIGSGKLDEEELAWALDIIGVISQLRSLACGEYLLAKAVNAGALAKTCKRVTLMGVEKGAVYQAKGVRQVRLCTGVYSTKERFPDVTMLCFNARRMNVKDERVKVEYEAVDRWAEKVERFVLIERDLRRISSRGLELKFKAKRTGRPDMFSVTLPARWTEWDIWSSDVVGAGVWDKCGLEGVPEK